MPDECACDNRNAGDASRAESSRRPIRVIKPAGDPGYTAEIEVVLHRECVRSASHGEVYGRCKKH